MAKEKTVFVCSACGYETPRWMGKCPGCNAWNTLEEQAPQAAQQASIPVKANKQRPGTGASAMRLSEIPEETSARATTGIGELDRVLGGGVVEGSLMLVGGDPGIGKSTLLLQASEHLARGGARVLYISGEESVRQIKMRARRLGVTSDNLLILSENAMDAAERRWEEIAPNYMVIDSIQTMYRPDMASAPGSVSQVRECASLLMRMAKTTGCAVFLVGHVTKEGAIAGPRVLEHMVDVVLYFEGDRQHEYRILRAVKNRFGSVNELGLFEMHERGMVPVENPSELLLSTRARNVPGSCVHCAIEGSRPMLVDVQALALQTAYGTPRRTTNGFDAGRLALLLAVLEKRAGVSLFIQLREPIQSGAGVLQGRVAVQSGCVYQCRGRPRAVRTGGGSAALRGGGVQRARRLCAGGLGGDRRGRSGGRNPRGLAGGAAACGVRAAGLHNRRHPARKRQASARAGGHAGLRRGNAGRGAGYPVRMSAIKCGKGYSPPFGVENSFLSTVWASLPEGGVTP